MGYTVAVIGATGTVGHEILNILDERGFPVDKIHALASERSSGREVSFGDHDIRVENLNEFDFNGVDIVLSSADSGTTKDVVPRATKVGAIVIDNSSAFRMDPDVPLVVPEVNGDRIQAHKSKNIIANPNCSTIQMVMALRPLADLAAIRRVVVSSYQSVSGAGKQAMDELFNQTRGMFMNETPKAEAFPKQITFNVIPEIGGVMDDGMTGEEWKMVAESKKILADSGPLKVCANCVRVPVFIGHGEMINIEFADDAPEISREQAIEAWRNFPGVTLVDVDNEELEYATPAEIQGEDDVYISRLRIDQSSDNGLNFWCVADNLRKGAALNAVQIAEKLIGRDMDDEDAA